SLFQLFGDGFALKSRSPNRQGPIWIVVQRQKIMQFDLQKIILGVMFVGTRGARRIIPPMMKDFLAGNTSELMFVKSKGQIVIFRIPIGSKGTTGNQVGSVD